MYPRQAVRETEWDLTTRTDSIRQDSEAIAGFYDEQLIFHPSAKTSTSTLYSRYQDYCKESGLSAKSIHKFTPDLVELCSIKLGLAVSAHRSSKGRSIVGLRFRSDSDSDADDANDAFKSKASPPLNPLPEQEVTLMTLSDNHNQNKIDIEEKEQLHTFTLIDEREELLRACKETTSCFRVG